MRVNETFLSIILTKILAMGDHGDMYEDRIFRENGEVLLFGAYPNDAARTSKHIENTLSELFQETGIKVSVAEDLPHQTGPRADHLRRVRVVSAGQVVFDRVMTVGESHVELVRWYHGEAAFDRTLL